MSKTIHINDFFALHLQSESWAAALLVGAPGSGLSIFSRHLVRWYAGGPRIVFDWGRTFDSRFFNDGATIFNEVTLESAITHTGETLLGVGATPRPLVLFHDVQNAKDNFYGRDDERPLAYRPRLVHAAFAPEANFYRGITRSRARFVVTAHREEEGFPNPLGSMLTHASRLVLNVLSSLEDGSHFEVDVLKSVHGPETLGRFTLETNGDIRSARKIGGE